MEIKKKIRIANDFSDSPGARYREDGDFSGQAFLEDILLGAFEGAVKDDYKILIDLDGVWGYPSSFISGSFGKLSLSKTADLVLKHIEFKSDDSATRLDEIIAEIKNPRTHDKK
ncbi:STAS-like domain-containing protein [Candidatus Nomurabacteria bacterium]|nr:STAS-like domain-containing protein [Candidatus Nomurabacteria bacterium]USN95022.1 MAG: STAS-like domain-containing protein [Candidatus Nomurabacteria bacterium]